MLAQSEFLMYSNSDMVYFDDLLWAAQTVANSHEDFLLVGKRPDVDFPRRIDFTDPDWVMDLRNFVRVGNYNARPLT